MKAVESIIEWGRMAIAKTVGTMLGSRQGGIGMPERVLPEADGARSRK